ncbi:MAG: hypothetical protein H6Q60_444 [Oscillospiraceae bacterium]|nr:hypothetical protein [Oscillospiraceae bacterium]
MKKLSRTLSLVLSVSMVAGLCSDGAVAMLPASTSGTSTTCTKVDSPLAYTYIEMKTADSGSEATLSAEEPVFREVSTSDWFYDSVCFMVDNGLMNGTGEDQFSPYENLSRAMLVTILYRMAGEPAVGEGIFSDVEPGSWYEAAVAWTADNEIVQGMGENRFQPDTVITREQIAAILYRYAQRFEYDVTAAGDLSGFSDAATVSSYAETAMRWAVGIGVLKGSDDGALHPADTVTRAEAAAMLQRFMEVFTS